MKISYSRVLTLAFGLFILIIPLNSLYDTIAFFQGTIINKTIVFTPIIFKVFKDLFVVIAFLLIFSKGSNLGDKNLLIPNILSITIFCFFTVTLLEGDIQLALIGLRSYTTLIFIYLGFTFPAFSLNRIYRIFKYVFFLELVVQILQVFYAPNFYGYQFMGLNLTNPGSFLIPSTMASFAIYVHYLAIQLNSKRLKFLTILSVFLARSSTAWIILILYYLIKWIKRVRVKFEVVIAVVFFMMVIIFLNLDTITGRANIVNNLLSRLSIFQEFISKPFGQGFGLGSGSAVLLHIDNAIIADSTINSLVINMGYIGIVLYILLIVLFYLRFGYRHLIFLSVLGFSFTMIIFEMTPFIQLVFFELGRRLSLKKELELK